MKIIFWAAVLAALAGVLAGCDVGGGGKGKSAVDEAQFVVDEFVPKAQQPVEDEENARAGLSALGRKTRVVIEMDEGSKPLLRAEIRYGNCDVVTGGAVYLLNDVTQGKSETVLDVPLRELREGGYGYFIMIRRLNEPTDFTGLCGDIALAEEG